ncbi:TrmH family RNA methyltransferase [Ekhidna sp.]
MEYPLTFQEINPDPELRIKKFKSEPSPIIFLLDGLEDIRNVGALFRLADASRIVSIYGYKMNLEDNANKIERISRQTTDHIDFQQLDSIDEVRNLGSKFKPIALEYTNQSIAFNTYSKKDPCMLIIGNERRGVSKELLELCHESLHIPMLGKNSSMNVSVAAGIVTYHLLATTDII